MVDCAPHFSVVADGTSSDDHRLEGFHLFPSDEVMFAYADYFAYYMPGAKQLRCAFSCPLEVYTDSEFDRMDRLGGYGSLVALV